MSRLTAHYNLEGLRCCAKPASIPEIPIWNHTFLTREGACDEEGSIGIRPESIVTCWKVSEVPPMWSPSGATEMGEAPAGAAAFIPIAAEHQPQPAHRLYRQEVGLNHSARSDPSPDQLGPDRKRVHTFSVSDANRYYPNGDIIWREGSMPPRTGRPDCSDFDSRNGDLHGAVRVTSTCRSSGSRQRKARHHRWRITSCPSCATAIPVARV
jgi:hypothetical protein